MPLIYNPLRWNPSWTISQNSLCIPIRHWELRQNMMVKIGCPRVIFCFFLKINILSDRIWFPDSEFAPSGRYSAQKYQNWSKFAVKIFHADTPGQGLSKLIIKWIFTYLTKTEKNFKVLRLDFRYILLSVIEFWAS